MVCGWWTRCKERCEDSVEARMVRWGWSLGARKLFWHYVQLVREQIAAVIPISLFQVSTC